MGVVKYRESIDAPWQELEVIGDIYTDEQRPPSIPDEAFNITGNCQYRFSGWDWFINMYGHKITTKDITNASYMFLDSKVTVIPFEINAGGTRQSIGSFFRNCTQLVAVPKFNGFTPTDTSNLFQNCQNLREIPNDIASWMDWSYLEGLTNTNGGRSFMFSGCSSLRSIPIDFLARGNRNVGYSSSYFANGFSSCSALDELVNLPIPYTATWTGNAFNQCFSNCNRLKNLTFEMPNGAPKVVKWKSQTIDLSNSVGYAPDAANILNYNSGISADYRVKDMYTYNALKNNDDYWTTVVDYSRYNHDSAVATINSLPDASAYLATAGGTNTIKFKKIAGNYTDGGSINGLTAEEIAVATAKGWTVTLV